ncbi:phosphoenolpyruvate kinase [Phragmitibacter flavus]|uniref:Phosphoenolpyruvate kinase n=1 Tax=Phragmitibacter flavus TaxID=2576071 RepID=A0A5R8KIS6_9BACT|nr:phosphoenolpyruvate kinase [Phragmitibacter flavus]TLD72151.1 phosphoenolpyruvate kinase [Phragmitibacter flavus]
MTTLSSEDLAPITSALSRANTAFIQTYPGESNARQPVHTVYGGGHLFKSDTARRLGDTAIRNLEEYAPDPETFAHAFNLDRDRDLPIATALRARVLEKLQREPTEDFRLDYEDGYGNRLDSEEDAHAAQGATEVAKGLADGTLPPFIGIRIKPMNEDLRARATRTLDIFITTLIQQTDGKLPDNFVITIPKVQIAEQVIAVVQLFRLLEKKLNLAPDTLRMELMLETPQAIIGRDGKITLPSLIEATQGRCTGVHFGVYDYTAGRNITAAYQGMSHPVCDFAREIMAVSLAGTGIFLSDGATNILPVGPHRAAEGQTLTKEQTTENHIAVHQAWNLAYRDTQHSLKNGIYQGWDLHPGQFIARYAAVYQFFQSGHAAAASRLKAFVSKAALASLHGDVFDDAATGQGLLNFFLRGISCGAITEAEAQETGLTLEEIRTRSFLKILLGRRK